MFVKDQEYIQLPATNVTLWYDTEVIFPQWFIDNNRPMTVATNQLVILPTLVYQGAFREGKYKKFLFADKQGRRYIVGNHCKNYFLNGFSGPVDLLPEKSPKKPVSTATTKKKKLNKKKMKKVKNSLRKPLWRD